MCSYVENITPTKLVKARKDYNDDCGEFIMEVIEELREGYFGKLTFKEWRLIAEGRRDKWRIKKGTMYEVQVNKMDGEIYSFRARPGLMALCTKYRLYPD